MKPASAKPTLEQDEFLSVLDMVIAVRKANSKLTYSSVAIELGRDPRFHARYVGSLCNKLDASAVLGGVPVLALDVVRTKAGDVNPKAMPRQEARPYRVALIKRAQEHTWGENDFRALRAAANELRNFGPKKAWDYVRRRIGDIEAPYRELAGLDPSTFVLK